MKLNLMAVFFTDVRSAYRWDLDMFWCFINTYPQPSKIIPMRLKETNSRARLDDLTAGHFRTAYSYSGTCCNNRRALPRYRTGHSLMNSDKFHIFTAGKKKRWGGVGWESWWQNAVIFSCMYLEMRLFLHCLPWHHVAHWLRVVTIMWLIGSVL